MPKNDDAAHRIFIRYVAGNILILALPVILAGIYYSISINEIERSINETTANQLDTSLSDIERLLHDIQQMSVQLSYDYEINNYLCNSGPFTDIEYYKLKEISQKLSPYVFGNALLGHAFLYMEKSDFIVFESGFGAYEDFYSSLFSADGYSAAGWRDTVLRSPRDENFMPNQMVSIGGENITGHIYRRPIGYGEYFLGAIVGIVDRTDLKRMLTNMPQMYGGWVFISDAQGNILSSTNPDSAEVDRIRRILPDSDTFNYRGGRFRIYRTQSSFNDWKYTAVLNETRVFAGVRTVRNIAYFLLGGGFLVGVIAAYLIAYTNTRPIGRLFDLILREEGKTDTRAVSIYEQIEQAILLLSSSKKRLENEVRAAETITRTYFFQNLFRGYYRSRNEFTKDCRLFNIRFSGIPYYVIICRLASLHAAGDGSTFPRLRDTLLRAAERSSGHSDFIALISFDDIAFIRSHAGTNGVREDAVELLNRIRMDIDPALRGDYSFGIGSPVEDPYFLIISYNQAVAAVSSPAPMGNEIAQFYDDVLQTGASYFFPIDLEKSILKAVHSANIDLLDSLIDKVQTENFVARHLSTEQSRNLFIGLQGTVLRLLNDLPVDTSKIHMHLALWTDSPLTQERFEGLRAILLEVVGKYDNGKKSHNTALKNAIERYIESHFSDPDLSLAMIAEDFGKSENYISNFFKEQTGECLSAAIHQIRFSRAAQIIEKTDFSVKEIAARCGYNSTNSFRRAFKRFFGLSPSEYKLKVTDHDN